MVIDLTVEDDGLVGVFTLHGLIAEWREINDLQPDSAQRNVRRFEDTLLVRSAMYQALRCGLNAALFNRTIFMCVAGYAAQIPHSPKALPHTLTTTSSAAYFEV